MRTYEEGREGVEAVLEVVLGVVAKCVVVLGAKEVGVLVVGVLRWLRNTQQ